MTLTSTIKNLTSRLPGVRRSRVLLRISCVLSCALGTAGYAQAPEEENTWYQVEVVIFERMYGGQSGDREVWPKDVDLHYPEAWQKLISPEEAEDLRAKLTATKDPSGALTNDSNPATSVESPLPVRETDAGAELAFVLLPESERTLNESTGGIARARDMRVLFHEAWRQPILPADEGPSIIIQGGNNYGDHTELEGSIHLSVSRYLHVYTNLWLTQFVPNYGQESEHWPPLPTIPERRPPSAPVQDQDEEPLPLGFSQPKSAWDIEPMPMDDYTSLINQPYLIKEIVTLHQTRRMRSGELHYIDHPRMGLLIKIDTYDPNEDQEQE